MQLLRDLELNIGLIKVLQQFNIRFVEQLAPILATLQGQIALSRILDLTPDAEDFRALLQKIESSIERVHGLSLSNPNATSFSTGYTVAPQRHHGMGYFIPELRALRFGGLFPRSLSAGGRTPPIQGGQTSGPRVNCTPVRNQYSRGTCTAFSAIALLEARIMRQTEQHIDLSEQYLWYRARLMSPKKESEGTSLDCVFDSLQQYGVCDKSFWPYERYNDWGHGFLFQTHSHPLAALDKEAGKFKIKNYQKLLPTSVDDIKGELLQDRLVSIGVPVFENSWDNNGAVESDGEITLPLTRIDPVTGREIILDTPAGGHALAIVGFRDTPDPRNLNEYRPGGGYFIIKNSWGTGWATNSPSGAGLGARRKNEFGMTVHIAAG